MGERFFHNFEWPIFISILALIIIGLMNLYSVGHVPEELKDTFRSDDGGFFHRQLVWSVAGLLVMMAAYIVPFRYYEGTAVIFYFLALIFLIVVLLLEPSKGSSRWIILGGFRFQPSEVMKAGVIFLLARFLAGKRKDPNKLRILAISFIITLVPFLLVMKQPDLGTALVFPALLFPMLYWRGLSENMLILFVSPVISAFLTIYTESAFTRGSYPYPLLIFFLVILVIAYRRRHKLMQSIMLVMINLVVMLAVPNLIGRLKVYQQRRILAFFKPESDILGMGWQVFQSKVAIGSGGFSGKGYLQGTQKLFAFLPERHSDFAYSVLSEENGFIGSIAVVILFAIIVTRGLYLATKVKNRFASLAAIGISSYFAFHVIINIGMTIGLAPVTGLPLPLLSYGGSSMLLTCFLAGVLMNFGASFYEY